MKGSGIPALCSDRESAHPRPPCTGLHSATSEFGMMAVECGYLVEPMWWSVSLGTPCLGQ